MSHSQFHCIPFILRHAWLNLWDKHMTTGRINQITILKRPQSNRQVVRFAKVWEISQRQRATLARAGRLRTCAFVTCNQLGRGSESAPPEKRSFRAKACSANLRRVARSSPAAGFAVFIDLHTLVTHNHTIICGSLTEGLTCSPCARHAQASCHKKDVLLERWSLKLLRLAALNIYSLQVVQFALAISEIVSLLYIAKIFSVRVAIDLIKSEIKQCRKSQLSLFWSITKMDDT